MTACPLCLLGHSQPHTKDDWKRFARDPEMGKKWERLLRGEKVDNNDD